MHVTAAVVNRAADVAVGIDDGTQLFFIEHFDFIVAIARPEFLLRFEVVHLFGVKRGEHAAVFQITLDVVTLNAFANDAIAFERHVADQFRSLRIDLFGHGVNVAAVAIDQLAAVTTRCAEAHLNGFQNHHLHARLGQKQRGGQTGITRANHADVCVYVALQCRTLRRRVGRGGVIGFFQCGVCHTCPL